MSATNPVNPQLDGDAFDALMTALDPALIVVTTAVADERAGCLVGFHAQSSIDPQRYCIWLSKANHTYRLALRAKHLAIHFLAEDQLDLAERFGTVSGDDVDKFEGLSTETGSAEIPLLADAPHRLVVRRVALLDEGADHVCVTTEPIAARSSGTFRPLRLSDAVDLVPGHDNTDG